MIGVDSTAEGDILYVGDKTASEIRKIKESIPSSTWLIHNAGAVLGLRCKWCGDDNCPRYIKGACWKCWRNRHPGSME